MKVSRVGSTKEAGSTKKKVKSSAAAEGKFAESLMDVKAAPAAPDSADAAPIGAVDGILAAQTVNDATDDTPVRRRLLTYGDDILDRLDELRIGVLTGSFSKDKLTELAQNLRQKRSESTDPKLNEIIQEIELRAEVEIAKYSQKTS